MGVKNIGVHGTCQGSSTTGRGQWRRIGRWCLLVYVALHMPLCNCIPGYASLRIPPFVCVPSYASLCMRPCVCVPSYPSLRMRPCVCSLEYDALSVSFALSTRSSLTSTRRTSRMVSTTALSVDGYVRPRHQRKTSLLFRAVVCSCLRVDDAYLGQPCCYNNTPTDSTAPALFCSFL